MSKRSSWFGLAVVAVITAVALVVGYWYVNSTPTPGSAVDVADAGPIPRAGEVAPAAGDLKLGSGNPTWLVFMATWCPECRVEAPDVEEASTRGDVRVVGIFVGEEESAVADYAGRIPLTFATIPDETSAISAAYGVRSLPTHFFVDGEGVVQEVAFGALDAREIRDKLDALSPTS